jgi:ubiquinone/menaquinone biosynthesis C-methylase UbiE
MPSSSNSSSTEPRLSVGEIYDHLHTAQRHSAALKRVWLHASGNDYPAAYDHLSFITLSELQRARLGLRLSPGQTLVDLACGTGGPGLWLSAQTGARLIGVDLSEAAIDEARLRAIDLGLAGNVEYRRSSFEATGLRSASADGAFSVDALVYAADYAATMREIARILRPGARLVATTFEFDPKTLEALGVPVQDGLGDFRPILETAGFHIVAYEETPGWAERLRATYHAVVSARDDLIADTGPIALKVFISELSRCADATFTKRRVFITAERR